MQVCAVLWFCSEVLRSSLPSLLIVGNSVCYCVNVLVGVCYYVGNVFDWI